MLATMIGFKTVTARFYNTIIPIKYYYDGLCQGFRFFYNFKGALEGLRQFSTTESPVKDETCFSFHLKSSFRTQDISVFFLEFLVM